MAINVFDMFAKLSIDSSEFDAGMSKAQGVVKSVGGGISKGLKVAGAAIGAATTAVVGFGAASVKTGMSFDKSMSQVAATMGMTSSEMEKEIGSVDLSWGTFTGNLTEYAMEMGEKTQFSATEAADALNYMALAGYDTQTSMSMLPNVLNLAAAGVMGLADASDMITDTQTAFGISLERTTQMVDEMAKAASTGNTDVTMLGQAFLTIGANAQELNGGFVKLADGTKQETDGVQELETALVAMANAGIKGSEAGTHMRNMLLKLSGPTDDGAVLLRKLGVEAFDTEDNMKSLGEIFGDLEVSMSSLTQEQRIKGFQDLFNTRDMSSAKSIMLALTGEYVKYKDEIYDVAEAQEKFGDAIYDTSQGFEYVRTSWDEIGSSIQSASEAGVLYEGKLYSMKEAQAQFGDAINDTEQGFKILGAAEFMAIQQQDNLAGDMTKFDSALNGVKIRVSNELTPSLRTFAQTATDSLSRVSKAIKENGLEGGISEIGRSIADGLTQITVALPDAINAGINLMSAIAQGMAENAPAIGEALGNAASTLGSAGLTLMQGIADGMADFDWAGTVGNIADWINEAVTSEGAADFLQCATSIITSIMDGIGESAPVIAEKVPEIITNIVTGIIDNIDQLVEGGTQMAEGLAKGMINGQDAIIEQIPTIIESLASAILTNAPTLIASWIQVHAMLIAHVPQLIAELIMAIAQGIAGIITQVVAFGQQLIPQVVSIGSQVISSVVSFLSQLPAKIAYWIGYAVGRFTSELSQLPSKAKSKFDEVMTNAQEFFDKFKTEGPKKAKEMADQFIKAMQNLPSNVKKLGKTVVEKLKEGIQSAWGGFVTWLLEKLASIGSAFMKGKSEGKKDSKSTSSVKSLNSNTMSELQNVMSEGSADLVVSHRIADSDESDVFDYDRLANAIVKAFEQTDFTMEIDDREFGRIVRKAVAY